MNLLITLRDLEAELHHPGVRCSRARLEALLHPEFFEVGRSGRPYDRDTVVRHLAQTPPPDVVAWDHAVQPLAPDVALLTYRSAHRQPDASLALPARRCSVWRLSDAGWQLFYHQGTPAED
jgi:hypothetical protein